MFVNICDFLDYTDQEGFINEDIVGCLGLSSWEDETADENMQPFWEDPLMD